MKRVVKLIFGRALDVRRKRIRVFSLLVTFGSIFCTAVAALLYYLNGPR